MDTENKPRIPCTHILKSGKNKGYTCSKYNCKKHSGPTCNFTLKNGNICGRFYCKRHENICNYTQPKDEFSYIQPKDDELEIEILTNKDKTETCQICLDDFIETKLMIKIHCNHVFHVKCIQSWCKIGRTCPLCRAEIGSFY